MRALVAAGLFLTGAIAMSTAVADAQDKKDDKFPERVSMRKWVVQGVDGKEKFFLPEKDNLKAAFKESKNGPRWHMPDTPNGDPTIGSEITSADKDGNKTVWVVTKVDGGVGQWFLYVNKKEVPKKD